MELWQQCRELLREISALQVPEGVSRRARDQYEAGKSQRDRLAAELDDCRHEAARIEDDLRRFHRGTN